MEGRGGMRGSVVVVPYDGHHAVTLESNGIERSLRQVDGLRIFARGARVGDDDINRFAVLGVGDVDAPSTVGTVVVLCGLEGSDKGSIRIDLATVASIAVLEVEGSESTGNIVAASRVAAIARITTIAAIVGVTTRRSRGRSRSGSWGRGGSRCWSGSRRGGRSVVVVVVTFFLIVITTCGSRGRSGVGGGGGRGSNGSRSASNADAGRPLCLGSRVVVGVTVILPVVCQSFGG
jgi:hypothetical protein